MVHDNPRALALELLVRGEKQQQFSNIALDKALEGSALSELDKRLASVLFYGVTERKITLDYRISSLSSRSLDEIDVITLNILRLGLYQLMFLDKVPPHAAVNETVALCTRRSSGFVNGILRAHTRMPDIAFPDKAVSHAEYLSVKYSICVPLCKKFIGAYGTDKTESILKAFAGVPPTTLRVNTLLTAREELASHIPDAEKTEISPYGIKVKGSLKELYGFENGLFFVQDEASQICVEALDAQKGMTVMDICACPGSKSFGAAMSMGNEGKIYAFDLHAKKLPLISSGATRLGIDIIGVAEQDGKLPLPDFFEKADRVLCDVPCSGFGVIAKKPELRYKNPDFSACLPDVQLSILENACRYVKRGGTLIYSTCTVFPEENEENIKRFIERYKEFTLTPFSVGTLNCPKGYITLLPDEYPTDGFFIAKLTKG